MFRTAMQALGLLTEKVEVNAVDEAGNLDEMKAQVEKYRRKQSDSG